MYENNGSSCASWEMGIVRIIRGERMYEHNGSSCVSCEVGIGGITRGKPLYEHNGSSCASWEVLCERKIDARGFEINMVFGRQLKFVELGP
jgi:hypothetical protein